LKKYNQLNNIKIIKQFRSVDGGAGKNVGTTVIDASTGEIVIVREGLGIEKI